MNLKILTLNFLAVLLLQSCLGMGDAPEVTELSFEEQSDKALSSKAFRDTVHPLLKASCAGCHGDSGSQAPKHSVSDYLAAFSAVVDTGRVNFQDPAKSRLVKRLKDDRHYCWSDCESNAKQMLEAIEEWKQRAGTAGGVSGKITSSLNFNQGEERVVEVINGTLVLQAEDAELSGRFKVKIASEASGLKYISGDSAPLHPIGSTLRAAEINSQCDPTDNISSTTNGPYQLRERRRHVNQSGYIPYSSRVSMVWIDPSQRDAYEAALKDASITDYSPYFFTDAEEGDQIRIDSVRVLPEFVNENVFNNSIRNVSEPADQEPSATYTWNNQTNLVFDYFKPRFGQSGTEYFVANTHDVIDGLPDYVFRDEIYDDISDAIRRIYDRARNLGQIPVGMRVINGNPFNFSDKANQINFFHDYFMAELNSPNAALGNEGGGIRTIDRFVHYEVQVNSRETYQNVNWNNVDQMNLSNFGAVDLDLANLFTGGSTKTVGEIRAETYGQTLKTVFTGANCVNCHADGSDRPQYAAADDESAYNEAAAINNFINFDNPRNARPVERMLDDRHNCGGATNCNNLGNAMIQAFGDWQAAINAQLAAQASTQDTGLEALSLADRSPGMAKYRFKVTEAGEYNVWLKLMAPDNDIDRVHLQIRDESGEVIRNCRQDSDGVCTNNSPDDRLCRLYQSNTKNWEWYTPSIDEENDRTKWDLTPGIYTLEVFEDDIDVKIDLVAINKNPVFNPAKNLIDEGFIQDIRPRTLRYDLAELIGGPGFFEIDVSEAATQDSYIFRNPRFVDAGENIRFRSVKVLVNGSYELSNSTYSKLDRVTLPNSGILTYAPLVVLKILGLNDDEFAFVFEDLQGTNLPASVLDEDAPVPIVGRKCLELSLFENSVMPILNQIRLFRKDDYIDYTSDRFPGNGNNGADEMIFYTCTTCHNEEHPFFKMTTFFDNSEVLCEQALSRVDFGNFERSLLLRGINGTFNHPKLHFAQDVAMQGSGNNRRFRQDASDASGLDSSWRGNRLLKYTEGTNASNGEINLGAYNGQQREYLEKFIGTYQRVEYRRYGNVQSPDFGDILTQNGSVSIDENGIPRYNRSGRALYNIVNPADYVNNQGNLEPNDPIDGPDSVNAVDRNCMGQDFQNNNGVIVDPTSCGNNGDYSTEFENVKSRYRDAVINWMAQEKEAFQNQ